MYHFSMFHASHHLTPVRASAAEVCWVPPSLFSECLIVIMDFLSPINFHFVKFLEIEAEVKAVEGAAEELCPLKVVLDRVVLTSTGVLLGCWQVGWKWLLF